MVPFLLKNLEVKMEVLDWSLAVIAIVGGCVLGAVVLWDIICEVLG